MHPRDTNEGDHDGDNNNDNKSVVGVVVFKNHVWRSTLIHKETYTYNNIHKTHARACIHTYTNTHTNTHTLTNTDKH